MPDKNRLGDREEFKVVKRMGNGVKEQSFDYISENLSKGYSLKAIRKALVKNMCNEYLADYLIEAHRKETNIVKYSTITAMVVLLVLGLFFIQPMKIGFITASKEFNYSDNVNLALNNSYEYNWVIGNYGSLKSVRLDGSISKNEVAKVYLKYENVSYLVFDSNRLSKEGIEDVTGLAVSDNINQSSLEGYIEESLDIVNESEPIINNSIENNEKSIIDNSLKLIKITTQGGGSKAVEGMFEFKVSALFSWNVEHSKVCIKWDVNSVSLCYGLIDCCALIGLESLGKWNDTFYLSYGRYGSWVSNIVKAQIIYANYSLDVSEPYSDIVYSNIREMKAEFYEPRIEFKDICIETCLLPSLNASSYRLVFIVEKGSLQIDRIKYSIEREINVSENAPSLIKEIDNITTYKNEFVKLNLSNYFYDKDDDKLEYSAYKVDSISSIIMYDTSLLVPTYNFTGKRYMYFTASDGYYNASSNIFLVNVIEKPLSVSEVNVSEELVKPSIRINERVRWVKRVNASYSVINLSVNISPDALNVSVRDVKEDIGISEDKVKVVDEGVVKDSTTFRVEKRISQIEKIEDKLYDKKAEIIINDPTAKQEVGSINKELLELQDERNRLTGYAVAVKGEGFITRFIELLLKVDITGYVVKDKKKGDKGKHLGYNKTKDIEVVIEEPVEDIEIEYWTEAPISEEVYVNEHIKQIIISSDVHYENITAYTNISPEALSSKIRLYRIVNESRELIDNVNHYDRNNNSLTDYIEWIVPSLSNQTYELIIEISKAEHLDSSRNFVADVYDYVKAQDDNWTLVNNNEYIRVTFEQNLTSERDITIYARDARIANDSIEINGVLVPLDAYQKKMRVDEIRRLLENG